MFDKLEDLIHHYEELMNLLSEPDVANDANRFKKLMKEHPLLSDCSFRFSWLPDIRRPVGIQRVFLIPLLHIG